MLQVSRTCVREALRILQARRFLDIRKGPFIFKKDELSPEAQKWVDEPDISFMNDIEVRLAMEPLAVRLAISHAAGQGVQAPERLHEQFARTVKAGDATGMVEADSRFHSYIIERSRNKLLIDVNREMQGIINKYRVKQIRSRVGAAVAGAARDCGAARI